MPFVQRVVEPKYLSRTSLRDGDGRPKVSDDELQAITNCTLSNALRQLASLVLLAEDIFSELTSQLQGITDRSSVAQSRIESIGLIVDNYDPKKVPVPEGSLSDFALRKVHYTAKTPITKQLFTADTRPRSLRCLYDKACSERLAASLLDQLRKDSENTPYLLCTPVLSAKRKRMYQRIDAEIETRIPSSVTHLRKWTSDEAVGEVTAPPDASMRVPAALSLSQPAANTDLGSGDEEDLDHRLPSPEEQLRVIASKFPPQIVAIDTSGKFFDRMCVSRKSLSHLETGGGNGGGAGEADTVKRRTRSRKPRGKRRNTISGTDQKELREAIAGDTSNAGASEENEDSKITVRSHSSDLLKTSPIDPAVKKSHFNTLKQWGKSRLKMIGRSPSASRDSFKDNSKTEKKDAKSPTRAEDVQETVTMRKKRSSTEEDRRTHQRCASYSSSEKSIGIPGLPATATINSGVKLRGATSQRRIRRSGIGKDDIHSSSGNWSASSESGRTSIGSEITTTTVPPKSTTSAGTSNNSLNFHHGPPSSIVSRRRFLNTSGSGSVTSEGTLTPDIVNDMHDDLETSSEFSCDTEGYYTSFHMDSGLKTLKEEELIPSTPLHTSSALSNSSNSQNLTAENEYELFGKGSTSTTTSSAGTVCTTLMAAGSDRSLIMGPTVPERKSSLTSVNRSRGSIHSANASLDRSKHSMYSKSPFSSLRYKSMRSFNEKQLHNNSYPEMRDNSQSKITITSNVGHPIMTAVAEIHTETELESAKKSTGTSSPDSGHNTSSSPIEDSISSAHGKNSLSEQDYSESSDLEGTDRIERIKYKTTINSARIPSLCVITPSNSDDESDNNTNDSNDDQNSIKDAPKLSNSRPKLDLPPEEKENKDSSDTTTAKTANKPHMKNPLLPLNSLMCKLKGVLPQKLTGKKSPAAKEQNLPEHIYDAGDYVTIADVKNNNQKVCLNRGLYSNNDVVKKNLQTVLSGQLADTEYVSLNELPNCLNVSKDFLDSSFETPSPAYEEIQRKGAKVTLDSHGQVIFSSDTLKRRKGAHTTFEPGPFVQEVNPATTLLERQTADVVRVSDETDFPYEPPPPSSKPTSPQLGKLIIKAPVKPDGPMTTEYLPMPSPKPSTIITALTETPTNVGKVSSVNSKQDLPRVVEAITRTGAYVNINDAEGVSLSPTKDDTEDYRHSNADKPYMNVPQPVINERAPTVDLGPLNPTVQRYHTASLRNTRPNVVNYDNQSTIPTRRPIFWSLPKRSTADVQIITQPPSRINNFYPPNVIPTNQQMPITPPNRGNLNDDSIRISPINPRTPGPFKSSTPSNKENVLDLNSMISSPGKSSMTNEELYAVIHKSKKKLNIKDGPERSASPALTTISLSPVNSETSLYGKGTQRHPETGYLGEARTRNSWSVPERPSMPFGTVPVSRGHKPETTCADRYGPIPQTSRHDFKKLLLQHSVKLNTNQGRTNKLSASEQLKLSKDKMHTPPQPAANVSQINILDLSGSPKTYTHRRVMKVSQPSSPGRTSNLIKEHKSQPKIVLSPKSQWRFSSPRSDVLSTPIPEANNEDDVSNSSGDKSNASEVSESSTIPINTNQHFGARRSLIPIDEQAIDAEADFPETIDHGVFALDKPIPKPGPSRTELLQAKRAEFFGSPPDTSKPKLSSFRAPSSKRSSPEKSPSPNALETAL